jgi:hypothetical protein
MIRSVSAGLLMSSLEGNGWLQNEARGDGPGPPMDTPHCRLRPIPLQSLEVLESLRRCARTLAVFCQAGQVYSPRGQFRQFTYLRRTVV